MTSGRKGSVLILSLVMLLLVFTLTTSFLAIAAARCNAIARESRRAQGLALAESAVAALQARLQAGQSVGALSGSLSTGSYSAAPAEIGMSRVKATAIGRPLPLLGRSVVVRIMVTLVRRGTRWELADWREVEL